MPTPGLPVHGSPLVLFEDNHCLAVWKPPGSLTAHYQGGEKTLDQAARTYIREKYHKPGNVFLGIVHRLDRPVSGVLLFARTSKSAARLARQFREGAVKKTYWAIVEGTPPTTRGSLENWLIKDEAARLVRLADTGTPGARCARLDYIVRGSKSSLSWLEIFPRTGRKHQIRVQLQVIGNPVLGDARYGAHQSFGPGIALHARSLEFLHPIRNEPVTITAELPENWPIQFPYWYP
jgi:23S rRNA pseudouridine1911/1915/1917 synthase